MLTFLITLFKREYIRKVTGNVSILCTGRFLVESVNILERIALWMEERMMLKQVNLIKLSGGK